MPLFGSKKIDAVVVGVRYLEDGSVDWLRAYERRGPAWSDWKLFRRAEVVKRLQAGETWVTGERLRFQGGTFETRDPLRLLQSGDRQAIVIGSDSEHDDLRGVPLV